MQIFGKYDSEMDLGINNKLSEKGGYIVNDGGYT